MSVIPVDEKFTEETLLQVGRLCAQAVYKAPQVTGRVKFTCKLVTGEDLRYITEAFQILFRLEMYHLPSLFCYREAMDKGEPLLLLLIGTSDLNHSELNWNCGACGFDTCGKFNRFAKNKLKEASFPGMLQGQGPSCAWKLMDFSMATDWAAAAAWQNNVTNRVEVAGGQAALAVGMMEDCTTVLGLPLGPRHELYWYSRRGFDTALPYQRWLYTMQLNYPHHWATFKGSGRPEIKKGNRWWEEMYEAKLETMDVGELAVSRDEVEADLKELRAQRTADLEKRQKQV